MAPWALIQVCCTPHSVDKYPMPKVMTVLRFFVSEQEARQYWPNDMVHTPDDSYAGQSVYQMLWELGTPLNLDRSVENCNKISTVGSWMPESIRHVPASADGVTVAPAAAVEIVNTSIAHAPQTKAECRAAQQAANKAKHQQQQPRAQPTLQRRGKTGPFSTSNRAASAAVPERRPKPVPVSRAELQAKQIQEAVAAAQAAAGPDVKVVPIVAASGVGGGSGYRPPQVWRSGAE